MEFSYASIAMNLLLKRFESATSGTKNLNWDKKQMSGLSKTRTGIQALPSPVNFD